MATHCGLGQAIRVQKTEITRGTLAGWRKEVLVDVLMSLAMATGAIPGIQQHLEAAHKVAVASPAHGGGMEAAMTLLKGVGTYSPASSADAGDGCPDANLDNNSGDVQDPSNIAEAVQQGPPKRLTDGDSARSPGLCRSNWKGIRCSDDTCSRVHREYCLLRTCYPSRSADCKLWHPRSWTAPNVQGNGRKGSGQPINKAAKAARLKDTILTRENKLLRQEIALFKERSRLEARKHAQPPRFTSYRDAVISTPLHVPHPHSVKHVNPSSQPLASQVLQEVNTPSTSSATVLPAGILAAIQLAVDKAFQVRNQH